MKQLREKLMFNVFHFFSVATLTKKNRAARDESDCIQYTSDYREREITFAVAICVGCSAFLLKYKNKT